MWIKRVVFFLFVLVLFSCKSTKEVVVDSKPESINNEESRKKIDAPKPKVFEEQSIIFLNIEVYKDSIGLAGVVKNNGSLKHDPVNVFDIQKGQLICTYMDDRRRHLKSFNVDNPRKRIYEYTDGNGELQSRLIEIEMGQLTLRSQFTSNMKYLMIEIIEDDLSRKQLGIIRITDN